MTGGEHADEGVLGLLFDADHIAHTADVPHGVPVDLLRRDANLTGDLVDHCPSEGVGIEAALLLGLHDVVVTGLELVDELPCGGVCGF